MNIQQKFFHTIFSFLEPLRHRLENRCRRVSLRKTERLFEQCLDDMGIHATMMETRVAMKLAANVYEELKHIPMDFHVKMAEIVAARRIEEELILRANPPITEQYFEGVLH